MQGIKIRFRHFFPVPTENVRVLTYTGLSTLAFLVLAVWGRGPQGGHILAATMAAISFSVFLTRIHVIVVGEPYDIYHGKTPKPPSLLRPTRKK